MKYDDEDYKLYVLAEITYTKENENREDIFPADWYSINNYKAKVEIIAEALNNKCLIAETKKYQDRVEGIRLVKE
mgnify:FL=1